MKYDVAIIGGGLAGLSVAIQSAKAGYSVILFEKESYPQHKVCGEYISNESRQFLHALGMDLDSMDLPVINKLILTSPSGNLLKGKLDLGGFGISRYKLDKQLADLARSAGVNLLENSKVHDTFFVDDEFKIICTTGEFRSKIAIAAFGKRSNLDVKWNRDFVTQKPNARNNLVGIKYHIEYHQSPDTIALHNFENGYCGISAIEDNKYCLCYLTTAYNLKRYESIAEMEKQVLYKNQHLKRIFTTAKFIWPSPITISQISFDKKSLVKDHILMTGDTAGMITPLCGNGMSIALHSAKLAFQAIDHYLNGDISRIDMENQYLLNWQKHFNSRLKFGRIMQSLFGKVWVTNLFVGVIKSFPNILKWLIKKSHGSPF